MKPIQLLAFLSLFGLSLAFTGCRGGKDRQMVYNSPRVAPVQVETHDGVRVKAPFVDIRVPSSKQIPAANGVDVPIIDPK